MPDGAVVALPPGAAVQLRREHKSAVYARGQYSTSLSSNMPRWNIGDEDLADVVDYLKSLP